jgi:nitrate reductase beta subunit
MTSQLTEFLLERGAQASLERAYIEQYLSGLGYSLESLRDLPEAQAKPLMRAASLYASLRLTEVEARSHFVEEMHGGSRPM